MNELHEEARKWLELDEMRYPHAKAHNYGAEIVRRLLAENERDQEWKRLFFGIAETTAEGMLTYVEAHKAALARAEAAEAKLRALCEREPVAVVAEEGGYPFVDWGDLPISDFYKKYPVGTAFIVRPSMEGFK